MTSAPAGIGAVPPGTPVGGGGNAFWWRFTTLDRPADGGEAVGTASGLFRTFGYVGSIASSAIISIVFHKNVNKENP